MAARLVVAGLSSTRGSPGHSPGNLEKQTRCQEARKHNPAVQGEGGYDQKPDDWVDDE
jgi:hypothetical protein